MDTLKALDRAKTWSATLLATASVLGGNAALTPSTISAIDPYVKGDVAVTLDEASVLYATSTRDRVDLFYKIPVPPRLLTSVMKQELQTQEHVRVTSEDMSKRTPRARDYIVNATTHFAQINDTASQAQNDDGSWSQIRRAVVVAPRAPSATSSPIAQSLYKVKRLAFDAKKYSLLHDYSLIPKAFAATDFTADSNDKELTDTSAVWATARAGLGTLGATEYATQAYIEVSSAYYIARITSCYLTGDTIGSTDTVSAATIKWDNYGSGGYTVADADANAYITVIDYTGAVNAGSSDFTNTTITEVVSSRFDDSSWGTSGYITPLTISDLTKIGKGAGTYSKFLLTEGHDAANDAPGGNNYTLMWTDHAGVKPTLSVTYTVGGASNPSQSEAASSFFD